MVKETIEMAFIDGRRMIATEDLVDSVNDTKSISKVLKDKIAEIKDTVKNIEIKSASCS